MSILDKTSLFLTKHLPLTPIAYALCVIISLELILTGEITKLSTLPILIMCILFLLTKHKLYKFKLHRIDCERFFLHFQKNFGEFNFDNNYHCREVFDKNNNFQYTEVIISLNSDYRIIIEKFDIANHKTIPTKYLI